MKEKIKRTAAQTAVLMVILTLISKCLGFIREAVMAGFFGAGYITDSYVMAQSIPGILLGGVFAAVSTAYMPIYSEIEEKEGKTESALFTSRIINILIVLSAVASAIGFVFSDQIVNLLTSDFDEQRLVLTSFYVKITFLYLIFSSVAGILDAYLQYKNKFLTPIIAGYALNVMSVGIIIISAYTSYYYLAVGMLLGQMGRCIILIIFSVKSGYKYTLSIRASSTIKQILILAVPVFISTYIQQINTFVDKSLASSLEVGCISALYYSMLIVTLITGLTAGIFSTILYPKIAQANASGDYGRLSEISKTGINLILIVTVPFSLGSIFYGQQVVQIIYERGAFDVLATSLTGSAFTFYGIGLCFMALNELLMRIYYSMHDMKTPMIFAGVGVCVNIVLNLILVRVMGHNGLALATSIAFFTNSVLLILGLKIRHSHISLIDSASKIVKILLSAVIAVGASYLIYKLIVVYLGHIIFMRIVQLGIAVMVAAIVYLGLLFKFGVEEVKIATILTKKG